MLVIEGEEQMLVLLRMLLRMLLEMMLHSSLTFHILIVMHVSTSVPVSMCGM
jgi:hypothetical protein